VQEPLQEHDIYGVRGDQEADLRGWDQVRQANQRRGGYNNNNQRFNRSRSRDPYEVRQNSNRLGANIPLDHLVGLALRAEPN
jgi:hypothetical protein